MPFSIRIPRNIKGIAFVGYKTEKAFKQALTKDKSFLSEFECLFYLQVYKVSYISEGKQVRVMHYEVKGPQLEKADIKLTKWKSQEEALKSEEDIAESGRIFVRNLAYTTTEKDLEDLFSSYGK